MTSFLITYKPTEESPELGWPIAELRRLIKTYKEKGEATEKWRFHNRRDVEIGARVYLLLQGRKGPAIIGFGKVAGSPEKNQAGRWFVPVQFENLIDPDAKPLVGKNDLFSLDKTIWRTQSSGVRIPDQIAKELELLAAGD